MPSFNSLAGKKVSDFDLPEQYDSPVKQTNLLAKVFGVMFISLLFTSALSYGFAFLFSRFYNEGNEFMSDLMLVILIASAIGICVMAFVLRLVYSKGKHSILPSYIIFLALMSITISSVYLVYDIKMIIYAFGVSALAFGAMALFGYFFKGSIKSVLIVIIGALIGFTVLVFLNLFIGSNEVDWIASLLILAIILFITLIDVKSIKDTIYVGNSFSYNIVLYSAFMLYVDFIDIFLRILYYLVIISSKKK